MIVMIRLPSLRSRTVQQVQRPGTGTRGLMITFALSTRRVPYAVSREGDFDVHLFANATSSTFQVSSPSALQYPPRLTVMILDPQIP